MWSSLRILGSDDGGKERKGEGRRRGERKLVFNAAVSFLQDKTHVI